MENIANNLLSFRHLNDKGFCESHRNFPQGCLGFDSAVLLSQALRNHKRKTIAKQKRVFQTRTHFVRKFSVVF